MKPGSFKIGIAASVELSAATWAIWRAIHVIKWNTICPLFHISIIFYK